MYCSSSLFDELGSPTTQPLVWHRYILEYPHQFKQAVKKAILKQPQIPYVGKAPEIPTEHAPCATKYSPKMQY